jgi:hypothetical protein
MGLEALRCIGEMDDRFSDRYRWAEHMDAATA